MLDILPGSVAMHLRSGGIFTHDFVTELLISLVVNFVFFLNCQWLAKLLAKV